jgi:hypothetical protein
MAALLPQVHRWFAQNSPEDVYKLDCEFALHRRCLPRPRWLSGEPVMKAIWELAPDLVADGCSSDWELCVAGYAWVEGAFPTQFLEPSHCGCKISGTPAMSSIPKTTSRQDEWVQSHPLIPCPIGPLLVSPENADVLEGAVLMLRPPGQATCGTEKPMGAQTCSFHARTTI